MPSLLEVKSLSKSFGGIAAVRDFHFAIEKGEIVALIGPNGAGKTTTFNLISGFYKPDKGIITFKGSDITGYSADKICRIGVCRTFQTVRPFRRLTVLENVLIGALFGRDSSPSLEAARKKAHGVLELLNMTAKRDSPALALNLSEQRRLELARALAAEPELLLLDEVMAGLTPAETDEYVKLLFRIREKSITLCLIEHVLRAVMNLSERIIVMNNGMKLTEGKPEEVARDREVVKAYLGEKIAQR